jgi:hypothetical protein
MKVESICISTIDVEADSKEDAHLMWNEGDHCMDEDIIDYADEHITRIVELKNE